MSTPFWKMEGCANDFVVVYARDLPAEAGPSWAIPVCDRRLGVGGDGVLVIGESDRALASMAVWNADGSIAEMCGNGLRCVMRRLAEDGVLSGDSAELLTGAGVLPVRLVGDEIAVDMGLPAPGGALTVAGDIRGIKVSMGNPHFVVFADDNDLPDLLDWGPAVEVLPDFPHRTNVEWVQQEDPGRFTVRVWERGVGETQACGTGACAVGVAARLSGRTDRDTLDVTLPGGTLRVHWRGETDEAVTMVGPARTVFRGTWPASAEEDA